MSLVLWLIACTSEPAPFDPACGDGTLHFGELCDDGVNDGAYGGCEPGCRGRAPFCGDGEVDEANEGCDDGVNDGAWGSCAADCSGPAGFCGDGEVNGPEVCDDGENGGGYGGCRAGCLATGPRCGDGAVNGPEVCDDGVNDGVCGSCASDCLAAATAPHLVELTVRAVPDAYGRPIDTPDLYVEISDARGALVYVSEVVEDRDVPVTFTIDGLRVDGETWTLQVWDEDGGAFGDDDDLSSVPLDTTEVDGSAARGGARVTWVIEERTCD